MSIIETENLTKDYGDGRGIFDVGLKINEGETVGFVGTNGSGKTTTIRSILGFIKPTCGHAEVNGLESWKHSSEIVKNIGYVPGEIAFPDLKTGIDFLKSQAEFSGLSDMSKANSLIERLQLDPRANLKRMSKGMKQKTALVAALMSDLPIIILDEPTTGLDPLMRTAFLEIIEDERRAGKTILMSSHMFEELETTCDRVALINDGRIIETADMNEIRNRPIKEFKIEFNSAECYKKFLTEPYKKTRLQEQYNQVTAEIAASDTGKLLNSLKNYDVKFVSELPYTLEKHFKKILIERKGEKNNVQ